MKVKFNKTLRMPQYNGGFTLKDGDEHEVSDDHGKRLCADFPGNFTEIKPEKKPEKKAAKPSKDKSLGAKKNK